MKSFTSIALLAALASSASAVCTLSKAGHVWDLQIFDQVGCSKSGHYEEFHGTLDGNRCFNVASSLNDKVRSFVWTQTLPGPTLKFYNNAGCGGGQITALGTSGSSRIQSGTLSGMNAISSFSI